MLANTYRGPLRVRIDEKPMPEILHSQNAIVRVDPFVYLRVRPASLQRLSAETFHRCNEAQRRRHPLHQSNQRFTSPRSPCPLGTFVFALERRSALHRRLRNG
jgi:hypothetical protein